MLLVRRPWNKLQAGWYHTQRDPRRSHRASTGDACCRRRISIRIARGSTTAAYDVSLQGSDGNSGIVANSAFKTLASVQHAMRANGSADTATSRRHVPSVHVAATYPADSNQAWQAAGGALPAISGGVTVGGWMDQGSGTLTVTVSAANVRRIALVRTARWCPACSPTRPPGMTATPYCCSRAFRRYQSVLVPHARQPARRAPKSAPTQTISARLDGGTGVKAFPSTPAPTPAPAYFHRQFDSRAMLRRVRVAYDLTRRAALVPDLLCN